MSCYESDGNNVISDDPLTCSFYTGDSTASPPVPAVLHIPILKDIPASTAIKFTVLGIRNPAEADYPVGITVKLMDACAQADMNNLCTYYQSTYYL